MNKSDLSAFDGRRRVVIENITPQLDGGRYPIKRVPGEVVVVQADVFADGHDLLAVVLKARHAKSATWTEIEMEPLGNDQWQADFEVSAIGDYFYTVEGWIDPYQTWRRDLLKRIAAGQDLETELVIGAQLVNAAAARATQEEGDTLRAWSKSFASDTSVSIEERVRLASDDALVTLVIKHPDRSHSTSHLPPLQAVVDPVLARTGAWYEMFVRSCPGRQGPHGTLKDLENHLPHIVEMGFDVLYLPPIHPIGVKFRKGRNNQPVAGTGDPGSPWGIGAAEGGHLAVNPELGNLDDFDSLVSKAGAAGLEIALDIAFQCSPDHPWVREHPSWFKHRPDGSIQYAENPPKKYQDIYPINFETEDWQSLWTELRGVFEFWIAHRVRVFRVDNPHTKALPFWQWVMAQVRETNPDVIFLAEAFTRPRVMYGLAKMGFNQSYNYFPWRTTKYEIAQYFTELSKTSVKEYFRANLWPNTPDILPHILQWGGRPAFMMRLILAATLGSSYGIYGPAFELMENQFHAPGGEEYLNSEKYEIRCWDLSRPGNLVELVSRLNKIRRANPALHRIDRLEFHSTDNENLVAYSKTSPEMDNIVLVIVNLDPNNVQSGWVRLDLEKLGIGSGLSYKVTDLLTDRRYFWHGDSNYVSLRPAEMPAHIFEVTDL